jgi:hypothetical protein
MWGKKMNFLEELASQWYEYQGYFVRRNMKVGKRAAGGWECELDVVAFHPAKKHILHIEPSMDADPWPKRVARYEKKFAAGKKYIPALFTGLQVPDTIEQIAVFGYGGKGPTPDDFAGGRVVLAKELLSEITDGLAEKRVATGAIPESYYLLRTIQFMIDPQSGLGCIRKTR